MSEIYLSHNNVVSNYGFDSLAAVNEIKQEKSSLQLIDDSQILSKPVCTSRMDTEKLKEAFALLNPRESYTRLEQLLIVSLEKTIKASGVPLNERVGLLISTTKGNIDVLDTQNPFPEERAYLTVLGDKIKDFFGFQHEAMVLSNACVSGVLAIAVAKRFIQQGTYDHVFVVGGDLVTKFILSGFNAFQALSDAPCKPYDKDRVGINIGEVGSSVLVTKNPNALAKESVVVLGEASCNDANHISGPSRTGEGLFRSIESAMKQARISASEIDCISAHGTATIFNDEMEAIAFNRANLQATPINSLKGYFGHTLGASGLIETIVGMHSLHQNTLFCSKGFEELGVSKPLNVIGKTTQKSLDIFLKTASGFGGCNTATIFKKVAS